MRQYELVLIIQPELEADANNDVIERMKTMITDSGGEITKMDLWGSRQLAYEIEDFREGYYVYLEISIDPAFGTELKQNLRYIEPIIRYMLTRKDN
jgi:small subunit ribosomal protein S6